MLTAQEVKTRQEQAAAMIHRGGIFITQEERDRIEIVDFGLSRFEETGLGVLVYVNTERCCAKELALWPRQTCAQHRHPSVSGRPGKEETFRCRWGTMYLYVPGPSAGQPAAKPPAGRAHTYTVWHEIVLKPGDQYTLAPDTWHWFQGGDEGAVVSEFSTASTDENDLFADQDIKRTTQVVG
jgi:D-lyxose ketol-isomerase